MTSGTTKLVAALVLLLTAGCEDRNGPPPPVSDAPPRATTAVTTPLSAASADSVLVTVYKSATCGCCNAWVAHMEAAGFRVETHDVANLAQVKADHGVRPEHQSCHTAVVGDYVVEGHVPAYVVRRLLAERPDGVAGLAVPGMPRGSPGMEMPDGAVDDYAVIAFRADGASETYATP